MSSPVDSRASTSASVMRPDQRGIVRALAGLREERPFEMDAEHAGPPLRDGVAHRRDRLRRRLGPVGDEGRQQAVVPKRRARPRRPRRRRPWASSLNSTPPPPFTWASMKPGARMPAAELLDGRSGRQRRAGQRRRAMRSPSSSTAWSSRKRSPVKTRAPARAWMAPSDRLRHLAQMARPVGVVAARAPASRRSRRSTSSIGSGSSSGWPVGAAARSPPGSARDREDAPPAAASRATLARIASREASAWRRR